MKKINNVLFNYIFLLFTAFVFSMCSDSESDESSSSNQEYCLDWGATKEEVKRFMKDREPMIDESGYLCYHGSNDIERIAYTFEDDILKTTLVIHDDVVDDQGKDFYLYLKGYKDLGTLKDPWNFFLNEENQTMAAYRIAYHNDKFKMIMAFSKSVDALP